MILENNARMLRLILPLLIAILSFANQAQAQAEYTASQEGWEVSLDKAIKMSEESGKPIMANFTGSDWCGWCKRLKASVFDTEHFDQWANENVVLLELDFPRRKQLPDNIRQQNAGLQQAFQVRGYPTIWVFNMIKNPTTGQYEIQALAKAGYGPDAKQWTQALDQQIEASLAQIKG